METGAAAFQVCTVAATCRQGLAGTNVGEFASKSSPSDITVDSEGNIFALDLRNKRVQEFSSTPAPITATFGSIALSASFGTGELQNIALDPNTTPNHLFVSGQRSGSANRVAVQELDHSGGAIDLHGTELTPSAATGLAIAQTAIGANIYLASNDGGQRVFVLNEAPVIKPVTVFTGTTATFEGEVVSNGISTSYHFEYSAGGSNWTKLPAADLPLASPARAP